MYTVTNSIIFLWFVLSKLIISRRLHCVQNLSISEEVGDAKVLGLTNNLELTFTSSFDSTWTHDG